MIGCAASTGLSRCDERVRVTAAASDERPAQGRRDPGAASPNHGPGATSKQDPAAVLPQRPSVPGRPCCTGSRWTCSIGSGCWCARTRCCAGTATSSRVATPPSPGQNGRAGHAPSAPSASWCCAGRGENPSWVTAASTANYSSSRSKPPPPPCRRSSTMPGSTRRPSAPPPPGPTSSAAKPTPCSPATSSRPSP